MILNSQAAAQFPPLEFYKRKGFVKTYRGIDELAGGLGVEAARIRRTLETYAQAAAQGKDEFGKTTFPVTFSFDDTFEVLMITPSIHYTMGGLAIDARARVLGEKEGIVEGLFAAGEVTGGVHGANRLAGNSLLECVVFGRIAGQNAGAYVVGR